MNLPNKLTLLRIILIPFFILAFYLRFTGHHFVALAIFAAAAFTDFLDGHIARKKGLITDLGKFLDPIADKVLVLAAFVVMLADNEGNLFTHIGGYGIILGGIGVTVIVAREMVVSSLRMVAAKKGIVLAAEKSGKIKTFVTDIAIIVMLASGGVYAFNADAGFIINVIGLVAFGISVLLTIYSGVSYLVKNRGVFAE